MRLAVLFCLGVTLVALVVRYPDAIADLDALADANSALSYADREVAGGNSVVASQAAILEARARIPPDDTYAVRVGERQEGWSDLTADFVPGFAWSFLLPRRQADDGRWVLCYACDRAALGEVEVVWEGEDGVSLLRRTA